jgi:hypothetical protein
MLSQLFRTKFESNLTAFIVFLAMNALLGMILISTGISRRQVVLADFFGGVTLWLMIICVVAGGLALLRHSRERSSRLYAQLPVTSLQVRLAYWCHASLYLCISSLVLLLIMFYAARLSWFDLLQFTLLYFAHAGVLLAVISIVTSNTLRLIPEEIRKHTVVYFFLAIFITFLFLFAIGAVVAGYVSLLEDGAGNWSLLTLIMTSLCAALVTLDVYLFSSKQSYLD